MKPNTKALSLLLGITLLAFGLAAAVHQWNEQQLQEALAANSTSTVDTSTGTSSATTTVAATTTQEGVSSTVATVTSTLPQVFFSPDKVNQAVLEGYPLLANVFTAYGTGTAFESTLSWRVRDAKRHLLGSGSIMVHQPDAGIPGPFDFVGIFDPKPTTATGTLLIFEFSAKDGTPIHIVTIPVTFATSTKPLGSEMTEPL